MLSKSFVTKYLDDMSFSGAEASTLKRLGEYRGRQELFRQQAPEVLASLKQADIIESAESSNRLEGVTAPHERVEALVLRPTAPANRTEQEIAGYRDALNLIHEAAPDMAFSVNVIVQLHTMLYRFLPGGGGRWKMTQNDIVERNADGSIRRMRFTPIAPAATAPATNDLAARYSLPVADQRAALVVVRRAIVVVLDSH